MASHLSNPRPRILPAFAHPNMILHTLPFNFQYLKPQYFNLICYSSLTMCTGRRRTRNRRHLSSRSKNDWTGLSHGLLCYLQINPHDRHTYHWHAHHYQPLTTLTCCERYCCTFATKCSIIMPFNCHTLCAFGNTRIHHPHFSTGYGQSFLDTMHPTIVYAHNIPRI